MTGAVPLGIGPLLATFDATGYGLKDPRELARRAEDLDFDDLWVGDHLSFHESPWLESTVALAVIGALTTRARLGFSVWLPALRPHVWAAKQIGTLRHLFGDRFILGVGVGGEEPREWEAAGVPVGERGARTDALLRALPSLLAGETVTVEGPGGTTITPLLPAVPPPPVWVGGRSEPALRRAVRFGDAWLGAFVDPPRVAEAAARLAELSAEHGRAEPPATAVSAFVHICKDRADGERQAADYVSGIYGLDFERMRRYVLIGDEEEVAEGLAAYAEAGAQGLTLIGACHRPWTQLEGFADVRQRVLAAVATPSAI